MSDSLINSSVQSVAVPDSRELSIMDSSRIGLKEVYELAVLQVSKKPDSQPQTEINAQIEFAYCQQLDALLSAIFRSDFHTS